MATKTKPHRTWNVELYKQRRDEILAQTRDSLSDEMDRVYDMLTEDERVSMSLDSNGEQYVNRMIKAILMAVAADVVDKDWNAETLKPKTAQVKRIMKKRRV